MQRASEARMQTATLVLKGQATGDCSLQLTNFPLAAVFRPTMETSHSCDRAFCVQIARKILLLASDVPNNMELKRILSEVPPGEA
jgi:hypothetical protein